MDDVLKNMFGEHFNHLFGNQFKNFDQFIKDMEDSINKNFIIDEQANRINDESTSHNENKNSLREKYLKKFEENPRNDEPLPVFPRSIFDKFFASPPVFNEQFKPQIQDPNFDENLDAKIMQDPSLLKKYENYHKQSPFSSSFSSKSYSVSRIQRPDGSIEEKRVTKDSNGEEEKVTTRIIGDKSYSLIEKIKPDGSRETQELFNNFDADKIDEFNKMWSRQHKNEQNILDNPQIPIDNGNSHEKQLNQLSEFEKKHPILSKLFSWLK